MLTAAVYPSHAQDRGIVVVPIKNKSGEEVFLDKEGHTLVVGMSDYQKGWPTLLGVLKDGEKVKYALEQKNLHVVTAKNPTRDQLRTAIEDFINRYEHQ